jgi:hypothetical protein
MHRAEELAQNGRVGRGGRSHRAHLLELLVGGNLDLRHDAVLELVGLGLVIPELELGRILRITSTLCHHRPPARTRAGVTALRHRVALAAATTLAACGQEKVEGETEGRV